MPNRLANESKGDNRRIVKELEKAKKRLTVSSRNEQTATPRTDVDLRGAGCRSDLRRRADLYKNLAYVTK